MKKALLSALAGLALVVSTLVGIATTAAPSQASDWCDSGLGCGKFYHYAPDDGYDAGIMITCDWGDVWGRSQMVYEGNLDGCHDVDGVYAKPGTKIRCREAGGGGWYTRVSNGNWSKIQDWEFLQCVNQLS